MTNSFIELGASLASTNPIRNIFVKYDDKVIKNFRDKYNNTDIFTSVFLYDNEETRKGKQTGPLYFDLDGEFAQYDLSALVDFLTQYGCPKESIRIYYSGNKGFHCEIPFSVLDIEPYNQLNKIYEQVAKEIKSVIHAPSLDTAIYDSVRLWRLPNSINPKSGLYKIPLTFEETALPLEKIKELAKKPRLDFINQQPDSWDKFKQIYQKAKKRINNHSQRGGVFEPVGEGQRNDKTFRRAIKLKAEGKTFDEAVGECSKVQDSPPLSLPE